MRSSLPFPLVRYATVRLVVTEVVCRCASVNNEVTKPTTKKTRALLGEFLSDTIRGDIALYPNSIEAEAMLARLKEVAKVNEDTFHGECLLILEEFHWKAPSLARPHF